MLKKIKGLFKKKKPVKSNPSVPFWLQNDFHIALEEYDLEAKEESRVAAQEIATFNRVTLDILDDLQKAGHCNSFSFETQNVRKAAMGRIINQHLNKVIFHQQVEDVIDE